MYMENWIRVLAGSFVLVSLALGWWVSPWFFLFTAFVGANLFQFGLTNFCPMALLLGRFGVKPGPASPGCRPGQSAGG